MLRKVSFIPMLLLLFLTLGVYWHTKSPSILWVDAGTMIAASHTLGIPNPPGFPFYMLSSHLSSFLPLGTILARMQAFTIFFSLGLLFFVYKIILLLIQNNFFFYSYPKTYPENEVVKKNLPYFSAFFGTIALAFSYEYWSQSQNTDAFIFTYFFIVFFAYLLLKLNLKYRDFTGKKIGIDSYKKIVFNTFLMIAFIYGLAVGASPTVASFIPAVLYIMYLNKNFLNEKQVVILGFIFSLALTLVLAYLPIRASTYPFVNWGNPQTPELFINQLKGKGLDINEPEIGLVNGFTGSPKIFFTTIVYTAVLSFIQFTPLLVPFFIIGIYYVYKKNRRLFLFLILTPLTLIIYAGLYSSGNKESWLIQIWIFLSIFLGIGFYRIATGTLFFARKKLLLFSLCFLPLLTFYLVLDRSGHYYTSDYGYNLYRPLERNAILIGENDFFNSLSNYLHEADKYRPDVTPIVINTFYAQRWYRDGLGKSTNLFISDKIESLIQYKYADEYNKVVEQIIDDNIDKHPIYVTHLTRRLSAVAGVRSGQLDLNRKKYTFVPNGLSLRVVRANDRKKPNFDAFNYRFKSPLLKKPFYFEKNYTNGFNRLLFTEYLYGYEALGDWYQANKDNQNALKYYKMAQDLDPYNFEVLARFGEFYQDKKDYKTARQYLEKASVINPKNPSNYFNLGLVYKELGKTEDAKKQFETVKAIAFRDDPLILEAGKIIKEMDMPKFLDQNMLNQTAGWDEINDSTNNVSLRIPQSFSAKVKNQDILNNVATVIPPLFISNKLTGNLALNISVSGRNEKTINFEDYAAHLPVGPNEIILDSRNINIEGFLAKVQTVGTIKGDFYQRFILSDNFWVWQFVVYPGNSTNFDKFYQILSTFKPLYQ